MLFGLQWRDQLPPVVADELDALIARVSGFLSVSHNEDGTLTDAGQSTGPSTWTIVPFNSGMFTGFSDMIWTVTQADVSYRVVGDTMTIAFNIVNSSVSGTRNGVLRMAIPGGYKIPVTMVDTVVAYDNNTPVLAKVLVLPVGTFGGDGNIWFSKADLTSWAASVALTTIQGTFSFHVTR